MGVKWLKKETGNFRQRRREIGEVAVYYLSKQAVIIGDERGVTPYYILLQSWQERNKKPFQNLMRTISNRKSLTFMEVQLMASRYGVQAGSATSASIPPALRVS